MENEEIKKNKEQKELEAFSELLSFEFYDWRLKALADKIKLEQYRPKPKMLYY